MRNRTAASAGVAGLLLSVGKAAASKAVRVLSVCALLVAGSTLASAGPVAQAQIGLIGVFAGLGDVATYQQVLLFNQTDQDCSTASSFALVCGALDINNWNVSVSYIVNDGVTPAGPGTNTGTVINAGNDPTISPLYALPYSVTNSSAPWDTVVTQITFTGTLSSTSLQIWNPGDTQSSFFNAEPTITFTLDLTQDPGASDYEAGNAPGYLVPLLVDQVPGDGSDVPEPASFMLIAGSALAFAVRRVMAR